MSTGRWFRLYDGMIDDPKVQMLPAETFKFLVNLWCLSSQNGGLLPDLSQVAFKTRLRADRVESLIDNLKRRGLLDELDQGVEPHNWRSRQYRSDVSTDRVKRFRERKGNAQRNVSSAVSETPPEYTDTETERGSEANASGAEAPKVVPIDARTSLFRDGLQAVRDLTGKSDGQVRSLIGKWLKERGDDAASVNSVIQRATDLRPADPIPWIEAAIKARTTPPEINYRAVL